MGRALQAPPPAVLLHGCYAALWQSTQINMEVAMPRPLEALAEEVLQLAPEARARLLERVVASLDADRARDAA